MDISPSGNSRTRSLHKDSAISYSTGHVMFKYNTLKYYSQAGGDSDRVP